MPIWMQELMNLTPRHIAFMAGEPAGGGGGGPSTSGTADGDLGTGEHVTKPADSAKHKGDVDPLQTASNKIGETVKDVDPNLDPDAVAAAEAKAAADARAATVVKEAEPAKPMTDELKAKIDTQGFDPEILNEAEYETFIHSLDGDALDAELKRIIPDYDPNKSTQNTDAAIAEAKAEEEKKEKYIKMAKGFQDASKKTPTKPDEKVTQTTETPATFVPVRLTKADIIKELGLKDEAAFNTLPEVVRDAFTKKIEEAKNSTAQAVFEKAQAEIKTVAAQQQAAKSAKEAKAAFAKRDAKGKVLQQTQKQIFGSVAKEMGIPSDMQEIAFSKAKFTDKNGKARNLGDVFVDLKKEFPSMFAKDEPVKPKGNIGSGTGSAVPSTATAPTTKTDYRKMEGDPLTAAAKRVTEQARTIK